jgi:hypothetical protein
MTGVCGLRSEGTVTEQQFETVEEFYLLGDEGFGEELCVVRFNVTGVGDAPDGCDEFAGQQDECLWTHLVEYTDAEVVLNTDGACETSELGLDSAAISALEGSQAAYGYVFEYQGHDSVLLIYDADNDVWEAGASAGWNEATGVLQFDRRDGFCRY